MSIGSDTTVTQGIFTKRADSDRGSFLLLAATLASGRPDGLSTCLKVVGSKRQAFDCAQKEMSPLGSLHRVVYDVPLSQ